MPPLGFLKVLLSSGYLLGPWGLGSAELSNMASSLHLGYCLHYLPILQMRGPSIKEFKLSSKCRKLHCHVQRPLNLTGSLFPSHHTCQTRRLTRSSKAESRQACRGSSCRRLWPQPMGRRPATSLCSNCEAPPQAGLVNTPLLS